MYQSTSGTNVLGQELLVNWDYALFLAHGIYLEVGRSTKSGMWVLRFWLAKANGQQYKRCTIRIS